MNDADRALQDDGSSVVSVCPRGVPRTNPSEAGLSVDQAAKELLVVLEPMWQLHRRRELEVCLETGRLLCEQCPLLAPGANRERMLCRCVGSSLTVLHPELERMMLFATYCRSLEDLQIRAPDIDSWSKLRELMPMATADRRSED